MYLAMYKKTGDKLQVYIETASMMNTSDGSEGPAMIVEIRR